jgi:hypothetical protein
MELHMHPHHWEARTPDWTVAAISGFVAGAVAMVVELLWASIAVGISPWGITHKVAAIVMGPGSLQSTSFNLGVVTAALATHYVLGIVFGLILAVIIAQFHFDSSAGMVLTVGALFGLVLYLLNFYGMARLYPWFADMRGWATLATHLIFGMVAAFMYFKMERPEASR